MSQQQQPAPQQYHPPVTEEFASTLDEPITTTIIRDLKAIAQKMLIVVVPCLGGDQMLRDWDLWGPLILCLVLAMTLGYGASEEQSGLVFVAVIIGCALGLTTIMICDKLFYQSQIPNYPLHKVPPEFRLYSAVIASVGPPIGLFWYVWTAKSSVSWASPATAIIPFSWGNIFTFIAFSSYNADIYKGHIVASAASSNSLICRLVPALYYPPCVFQRLVS